MKWIWAVLLLLSFIKASPLSENELAFNSVEEFKFQIEDLDAYKGENFPFEKVKALIKNANSRLWAIAVCLVEKRFKALHFILAYRPLESTEDLKSKILLFVVSLNDPEIWQYFFTRDRMNWIFHTSACYYEQFRNIAAPLIGTFSYQDLAWFLGVTAFTNPGAYPIEAIETLKSYVSGHRQFLSYSPFIVFDGKFSMSVFFDFYALLNERISDSVKTYPRLLRLISHFNASKVNAADFQRLQRPFLENFSAIEAGRGQYKRLFGVDFTSPIFVQAVRQHYKTEIGSFIKNFILALVDCQGDPNPYDKLCITRVVTELIDLHTAANEPLVFYQFLEDVYEVLLVRACTSSVDLPFLDIMSHAIYAVVQHFTPNSLPRECFLDGHLRGVALYVLSLFPSRHFEVFLSTLCTAATSAEVFSIPSIETRALALDPNAFSSALGRLVNPKEALKYILNNSDSPDLFAIRNIYRLYTAETGDFQLIKYPNPTRAVSFSFSFHDALNMIVIRIETAHGEITQILGLFGLDRL